MKEKFTLKHVNNKEGRVMTFSPFGEGNRKSKIIAVKFRNFLRDHVSSTQYDAILKELTQDLEIIEPQSGGTIIVKGDRLYK